MTIDAELAQPTWDQIQAIAEAASDEDRLARLLSASDAAADAFPRWAALAKSAQEAGLADRWIEALRQACNDASMPGPWMRLARALHATRHSEEGFVSVVRARELAPQDDSVLVLLAESALATAHWDTACEALTALEANPDFRVKQDALRWAVTRRILALGHLGRFDDALEALRSSPQVDASTEDSEFVEGYLGLIAQFHQAGRFGDELELALRGEGWNVAGLPGAFAMRRLQALFALGRVPELLEPATDLERSSTDDSLRLYARFFLAFALEAHGRIDEARQTAEAALPALRKTPDGAYLLALLARLEFAQGRGEKALERLAEVDVATRPADVAGELELQAATALRALGRMDEFSQALERADAAGVFESRKPVLKFLQAQDALQRGRFDDARTLFAALAPEPAIRGAALFGLASAQMALHQFADAAASFREAAQLVPGIPDRLGALLQCARAEEAAGNLDRALEAAADVLTLGADVGNGEAGSLPIAGAHLVRARIESLRGAPDAALALADAALLAAPELADDLGVIDLRWQAHLAANRGEDARSVALAALQRPNLAGHPYLHFMLVETARRLGDGRAAREAAAIASVVPDGFARDTKAWAGAALARMMLGRFADAQEAFARWKAIDATAAQAPYVVLMETMLAQQTGTLTDSAQALAALERFPPLPGPLAVIAPLMRGLLLLELQRWSDANATFESVVKLVHDDPKAEPALGVQAHILRVRALHGMKRREDARAALVAAYESKAGASVAADGMRLMAACFLAGADVVRGEYEAALGFARVAADGLRELQQKRVLTETLWVDLLTRAELAQAQALLLLKRHEEALAAAKALADRNDPAGARALFLSGQCLSKLEDWTAARVAFAQARRPLADQTGADEQDLDLETYIWEATARLRLHEDEEARATLQAAIERHPQAALVDPLIWLSLGRAYHELQRSDAARRALERAQDFAAKREKDGSADLRREIALARSAVLIRLGKHDEALVVLDKAGTDERSRAAFSYNRGVACLEKFRDTRDSGWLARARTAFDEAAKAGSRDAIEALRKLPGKDGAPGTWFDYWFGAPAAWPRRVAGAVLSILAIAVLFVAPLWSQWQDGALDWKLMPIPALAALLLLLLPGMKNLALAWGDIKFSAEPTAGTGALTVLPTFSASWDMQRTTLIIMGGETPNPMSTLAFSLDAATTFRGVGESVFAGVTGAVPPMPPASSAGK